MTPIGHAVSGYLVGRPVVRLSLFATLIGAVAPDVDFALFFLDDFNALHRTFTHSLLFVAAVAAIAAVFAGVGRRGPVFAGAGVGGLLHLVSDSIMDGNPSNGIGVAWLWPATDEPWSPFNAMWFVGADAPAAGWGDVAGMLPQAGWAIAFEVLFCLALAAVMHLGWRRSSA